MVDFKPAVSISMMVVFILVPYFTIYHPPQALSNIFFGAKNEYGNFSSTEVQGLISLLKSAAFLDKTVIITTLNQAWAEPNSMIDLFLQSFKLGNRTSPLLEHLVVINLDPAAHGRCKSVHKFCFLLQTPGLDFAAEKEFMTSDYLSMMWRRIELLKLVLELGYNFVFTDTDILWLRDPFQHFSMDSDLEMACDQFNGNPEDLNNIANGGFVRVLSNERTIRFYKYWLDSRIRFPDKHDQDVFNAIKFDSNFTDLGLKVRFLSTEFFSGFCQGTIDLGKLCTIHANCCIGLEFKLKNLRQVLEDWKRLESTNRGTRK